MPLPTPQHLKDKKLLLSIIWNKENRLSFEDYLVERIIQHEEEIDVVRRQLTQAFDRQASTLVDLSASAPGVDLSAKAPGARRAPV